MKKFETPSKTSPKGGQEFPVDPSENMRQGGFIGRVMKY